MFRVPGFQHVPVAPDGRFMADYDDLLAGMLPHFFEGERLHTMRDRLVAFTPAWLPTGGIRAVVRRANALDFRLCRDVRNGWLLRASLPPFRKMLPDC